MIRVLATCAVVAAACVAVVLGTGATGGGNGSSRHYRIVFDNAFGLTNGGDFKVAGVRAGQITGLTLTKGFPPRAIADVQADQPGLRALTRDATCEVRPQSLIGEYFVDCDPGSSKQQIPDGGIVPVSRTHSTIPLDVVMNVLRKPYRERLRTIILTLGAGLAGRPQDLSAAIHRADPGLRETTQTLDILARQEKVLDRFISDSDTVIGALARNKGEVRRFVHQAARTASISATRRRQLSQALQKLPTFLSELRPTMTQLGALATSQRPVLRNIRRAAPDLTTTFKRLGPFADASRPGLVSLGKLSVVGKRALDATTQDVAELRRLSDKAPALAKPLRQFLQTIDDRKRAIEPDSRAAETAPPAPDKTAYKPGDGFTGMESLLNYFYWQTLAINGFDKVSHVLRFTILVSGCSPYNTNPTPDQIKTCTSWLGPHQPGITTPDPTAKGASAASASAAARAPKLRPKLISDPKPQPQQGAAAPAGGGQSGDSAQQPGGSDPASTLLDYLLGP